MTEPRGDLDAQGELGPGAGKILDVNDLHIYDGPVCHPTTIDRVREAGIAQMARTVTCNGPELVSLDEQEKGVRRPAQTACAHHERIEDWLEICWRGGE